MEFPQKVSFQGFFLKRGNVCNQFYVYQDDIKNMITAGQ